MTQKTDIQRVRRGDILGPGLGRVSAMIASYNTHASDNTQANGNQASSDRAVWRGLLEAYRRLYNPDDNDGNPVDNYRPRPRLPHPGDILYWIACVGAVCGLLFVATK
jgi:hypothetical protein